MRGARGALIVVVFAVACGGGGTEPTTNNTTGGGGGGGGGPITRTATTSVAVEDNMFTPKDIVVPIGATVTWTWSGATTPHNVTFDTGNPSPSQQTGSFNRSFPTAGTFNYGCTLHAGMTGSVLVQ